MLSPEAGVSEADEYPKTVRLSRTEQLFYFKPAIDELTFYRELSALYRIQTHTEIYGEVRVPTLGGIVKWDDDRSSVMGLLVNMIQGGKNLDDVVPNASPTDCVKWSQQIEETVKMLHDANVILGDVKPDNVVVDSAGDAWVIDFGGGCNPQFVDPELEGTKEGDLQGISRLKEFLKASAGTKE